MLALMIEEFEVNSDFYRKAPERLRGMYYSVLNKENYSIFKPSNVGIGIFSVDVAVNLYL
jgi:hypothetical protein